MSHTIRVYRILPKCNAEQTVLERCTQIISTQRENTRVHNLVQFKGEARKKICSIFLGKLGVDGRSEYSKIILMWRFCTQNTQEISMTALLKFHCRLRLRDVVAFVMKQNYVLVHQTSRSLINDNKQ